MERERERVVGRKDSGLRWMSLAGVVVSSRRDCLRKRPAVEGVAYAACTAWARNAVASDMEVQRVYRPVRGT